MPVACTSPPWGISHAEPIGSSNYPPLAAVALPPQMWQQLNQSLPQWGKVAAACRLTDEVSVNYTFSSSTIRTANGPPSPSGEGYLTPRFARINNLGKAKAFRNHQHWWFPFNKIKIHPHSGWYFSFGHSPNNTGCAQVRFLLACQPCKEYLLPVNGL